MKIVDVPEFEVAGIAIRTSNAREMSGEGVIAKHWERLFNEHVLEKVPNRLDSSMFAVYTDYESDQNGEYTLLLGAKFRGPVQLPPGVVARTVPAGRYAVITSDPAPVVDAVVSAWKKIWSASKEDLGGQRAYRADFELYDERANDPKASVVDVYIGLK